MFPVVASPRFSVNVRRISQRLYFAEVDDPDEGLKARLIAALATVRMFPEAYPQAGVAQRRFTFEYRSVPYTVLFTFDGELITLHDIHFSRSANASQWLAK